MRRTPAATALSGHEPDQADIAGRADMGAAAELDRVRRLALSPCRSPCPSTRRAPRRRTSRRTAPWRPRRWPRRPPSGAWSTGAFCSDDVVGHRARPRRAPRPRSAWGARNRSAAAPARPASPSARRGCPAPRAAPRGAGGWPNGWRGAACAARGRPSARRRRRPDACRSRTLPMWTNRPSAFFCVSRPRCANAFARDRRRCRPPGRRTRRRTASG